jgi:hypothetical protein
MTDIPLLSVEGTAITWGRGTGINMALDPKGKYLATLSISDNTPITVLDALVDGLTKHVEGMYQNVNKNLLGEAKTVIPIVVDGNIIDINSGRGYNDYLKNTLKTNLLSLNIGTVENPSYIYTVQPMIAFKFGKEISKPTETQVDTAKDLSTRPSPTLPETNKGITKGSRPTGLNTTISEMPFSIGVSTIQANISKITTKEVEERIKYCK